MYETFAGEVILLQANNSTNSTTDQLTQTTIIKQTLTVYGSAFAVLFVIFLIVRPIHPRVYNLKKNFPDYHVAVADDAFGRVSWMWRVFGVSYDDIREQCGMDAVTTVRLLEFGVKLSLVCMFNSIFLFPIYASMGNMIQSDPVMKLGIGNLPSHSHGSLATTFAAYIFFGLAMHFIDKDLEWFTRQRHKYLSEKRVQNYSVFLAGLPPEMQTNQSLKDYYEQVFSQNAVVDAQVTLNIPNLEREVARRKTLLAELEHTINVMRTKGVSPQHRTKFCGGEKVESVPTYKQDLDELNKRIQTMCSDLKESSADLPKGVETGGIESDEDSQISKYIKASSQLAHDSAAKLKAVVVGGEDGSPRNAAFVSFDSLASANIARQTLHQEEPWYCVPSEPPTPECVNWNNIGKNAQSKQIGELISLALTIIVCIFWTVPVSFVASLSNVQKLTKVLPFLEYPVKNYEWFAELLALLAPLLLVGFISLVPYILFAFIKFEGSVEIVTMQHPSLFSKLASFTIIQTFFISAIASTLFSSLQRIMKDPSSAFEIVAEALPSRAGYFIQIMIVQNLPALGIELLRLSPVALNIGRRSLANLMGYNLSEKERNSTFMGLRPLDDPYGFEFGRVFGSKIILAQMVLFVYGCMSPLTSYFTLLVFGFTAMGVRNQFLFVYPPSNDSGGILWISITRASIIW
ncbi:hypothetical protein ACHAWF_005124 [Thalassiosira exigua]